VSNGLGSPSCAAGTATIELSASGERNCQISGFQATGAPTSNYAFDVHIDKGLLGLGSGAVASAVQDLLITPVWMGLVWVVHALIVALEWCFTVDLLNSGAMSGVAGGLRTAQATFTQPWLVVVLAIAGVLAAYNGLVRRRVAETLGQALLMLAMIAGGLWVIVDPIGTVGALGEWANEASLGGLGAMARGTPAHAQTTLADGLEEVFVTAVGAPWCYMEFGNVRWCDDPRRLDPRLHAAGLGLAAADEVRSSCRLNTGPFVFCAQPGSEQAQALGQSALLLREAHTNGELFLALPANQVQRNSINESSSLLRVLCDEEHATSCRGPTAKQAEFRTENGTWPRAEGLLLIVIGALGMILLLGFIALRLLGAAIMSLFYLLLAPAAVLAPALGDGGRAAFRGWATRLLGALTAKLLYSVLLGVVLFMMRIILGMDALGWWVQWLLISALWWGAFRHRNQVLGFAHAGHPESRVRGLGLTSALMSAREAGRLADWAKGKVSRPPPSAERRRTLSNASRKRAREKAAEQVTRSLDQEHRGARKRVAAGSQTQSRLALGRSQLQRVRAAREEALRGGDTRRVADLDARAQRVQGETAHDQQQLNEDRGLIADGERVQRQGGIGYGEVRSQAHKRWLDAQAALPEGGTGTHGGQRRDYRGLAGLAGYEPGEYDQLSPKGKRQTRLNIDRELRARRELNKAADGEWSIDEPKLRGREQRRANEGFDSRLEERLAADGHGLAPSLRKRSSMDAWREEGRRAQEESRARAEQRHAGKPPVPREENDDVAAARKRQFGRWRKPK